MDKIKKLPIDYIKENGNYGRENKTWNYWRFLISLPHDKWLRRMRLFKKLYNVVPVGYLVSEDYVGLRWTEEF